MDESADGNAMKSAGSIMVHPISLNVYFLAAGCAKTCIDIKRQTKRKSFFRTIRGKLLQIS